MLWDYAKRLLGFAFSDFHIRTDVWYAASSVVVSATTGPNDIPIGNLTPVDVAWYVLAFIAAWALLRLFVLSPYRLWSEVTIEKQQLETQIASDEFLSASAMREYRTLIRRELSSKFSVLLSKIQIALAMKNREAVDQLPAEMYEVHEISLQLGDDSLDEGISNFIEAMKGLSDQDDLEFDEALNQVTGLGKAILNTAHHRKEP